MGGGAGRLAQRSPGDVTDRVAQLLMTTGATKPGHTRQYLYRARTFSFGFDAARVFASNFGLGISRNRL